jgi:Xaa-Pro dipeptidase
MTIGVGGVSQELALSKLSNMSEHAVPIQKAEYLERITKAQSLMVKNGLDAIYLNAGTNLYYFTGTHWYASERMVGAILTKDGTLEYIVPQFEIDTFEGFSLIKGSIIAWQEHECPFLKVAQRLAELGIDKGQVGIDESTAFFISDGLKQCAPNISFVSAKPITAGCRMRKSIAEINLLKLAKEMTLEVHKATASILVSGISTQEVTEFINAAHQRVGAKGSSFCIVLFGKDSSFPHGVKNPKRLEDNNIVLIDTGCLVEGYNSDITRTYVFGEPTARQREIWTIEKQAQAKAFAKAQLGTACGEVDIAARNYIAKQGLGPDYQVPGLPHRTGHGVGLDIHEWPYLVKNDRTPLDVGMCFSNEPMLVIPNEFGVRLEDHFYMSESGPQWFTQPSHSIDDPFGLQL